MNLTRKLFIVILFFLLACYAVTSRAAEYEFGPTYAAVAYSTSTGKSGYAWNHPTRRSAERAALSEIKATDATIVGWVTKGWLVLIIGDDNSYGVGWRFGNGARLSDATQRALDECLKRTSKIRKVIRLGSGDFSPQVVTWDPAVEPSKLHFK